MIGQKHLLPRHIRGGDLVLFCLPRSIPARSHRSDRIRFLANLPPFVAQLIRAFANRNLPIVTPGEQPVPLCLFNLVTLRAGETQTYPNLGCETLCVVLSGRVDVMVDGQLFANVGRRANVWDGPADSVYCGTASTVKLSAQADAEIAIAGGVCPTSHAPFRITSEEVSMVEVGSAETHSRRRIFHILGQNAAGRAGNLLVSELYADAGCWSGYPPHKHDTERPPEETDFEEVYHYRFRPGTGFGAQFSYAGGEAYPKVAMTRHGDTFLIDHGYHPTVASPGHESYIFTILVGRHQRSLVQSFEPQHQWLMDKIPGVQAMRDKFK